MKRLKCKICMLLSLLFISGVISGCSKKSETLKLMDTVDQIQGMEDYAPSGILAETFFDQVTYEISDITWDGESGIAEVKIITPDLAKVISNSIKKVIDKNEIENYDVLLEKVKENIQDVLDKEDYPAVESIIEMDAKKTENGYELISNEEFERVISGNLEEIFIQALMEGLSNENSN